MAIDKELILKLRQISSAGFSDCKLAIELNNNNLDEAVKWLRKKGISKAIDKNSSKVATEGSTFVGKDKFGGAIIVLSSETDFTAHSQEFLKLSEDIVSVILENKTSNLEKIKKLKMKNNETVEDNCLHLSSITGEKIVLTSVDYLPISEGESISCYRHNNGKISSLLLFDKSLDDSIIHGFAVHYAAMNPRFLYPEDADDLWLSSEKEIISELIKKENKPPHLVEKIFNERLKKIIDQNSFVGQNYLFDSNKKVSEKLKELGVNVKKAIYRDLSITS